MNTPREISNSDDIIDIRDVIARIEDLAGDIDELKVLSDLLAELKGNGGDEQWRGDWYPITLIRDSHFRDYAKQLADDIGAIKFAEATWPNHWIDWEHAARELQSDYSSVELDGITYWYR